MLYHAILQLNQKATQTKRVSKQKKNRKSQNDRQEFKQKQTKKQTGQQAFNKQNTISRRNEFKLLANTSKQITVA
jgi:hypothetical protein